MERLNITHLTEDKANSCVMQDNQRQAVLWAYLAGLIDGEGSFVISKTDVTKISKSSRSKSPRYLGYFCIGMVDKEPLDLIISLIGCGKVYEERVPDRRSIWRIRFGGRLKLIPFINKLLPYLIVKKQQALTLLSFLENWETPSQGKHGYRNVVSIQELQRREDAHLIMRKLNVVGAAATTKSFSMREHEAIV